MSINLGEAREVLLNPSTDGATADAVEAFLRALAVGTVEAGAADAGIEGSIAVLAVSFADFWLLILPALYLVFLIAMAFVHKFFYNLASHLPGMFNIRGAAEGVVNVLFPPPAHWVAGIENRIEQYVIGCFRGLVTFLESLLPHLTVIRNIHTGAGPISVNLSPLWNAIHQIQETNVRQNYEIRRIEGTLYGATQAFTAAIPTLEEQIITLGHQIQHLAQTITDVSRIAQQAEDLATHNAHEIATIATTLHGVTTTVTSWPEIEQALLSEISTLGLWISALNNDVAHDRAQLTRLLPLGLLLQAGDAGLRNLRKLEDDPCQCPKFKGVPNELGTAVALLEFIENG